MLELALELSMHETSQEPQEHDVSAPIVSRTPYDIKRHLSGNLSAEQAQARFRERDEAMAWFVYTQEVAAAAAAAAAADADADAAAAADAADAAYAAAAMVSVQAKMFSANEISGLHGSSKCPTV
jgi:hypothetical protein